jgi:outer membrane immunogenic protein
MKRSFVAGVLIGSAVGMANAADMPMKAPSAPSVVSDWAGFYLGVHGGYGWARFSSDNFDPVSVALAPGALRNPQPQGTLFGGHAGFNWQRGAWVGGLEIDFSGADLKETQSLSASSGEAISLRAKIDMLATARARFGFLPVQNLLVYGTGGFAWGHASAKETICTDVVCSTVATNESMFGWTAGAGLEYKLVENLLLRVEYLHYDFVKQDFTWANQSLAVTPLVVNAATRIDAVRGGISYKF